VVDGFGGVGGAGGINGLWHTFQIFGFFRVMNLPKRIGITALLAFLLGAVAIGLAGEILSHPVRRTIGDAPPDLGGTMVQLAASPTETIYGWFARGHAGGGALLLLHGVRSDRTEMLDRARFLKAAGYSVLLIDLQAHGESTGHHITFGAREGLGVLAALRYLQQEFPGERIGVIGVSLGAASLVLAKPAPAPDAVVLESMYPTIADAVADRLVMRIGELGNLFAPLLLWQLPLRLGVSTDQLRPIVEIPKLKAPVLIASGTMDQHTTWAETERIFAAANEPKELWAVDGAAHVDLCAYSPAAYQARILQFLSKNLRGRTVQSTL
jgi:fermentation-respiration switch protein FrsA (DUF1100 family)